MRLLTVSNCNRPAIVDDEDYEKVAHIKWTSQHKSNGRVYVTHAISGTTTTLRLHRVIMGAKPTEQVDHIDHDGLNNQKSNLRIVTSQQNTMNRRKSKNMTSQYKGVFLVPEDNLWRACIRMNNRLMDLGRWDDERKAAAIYNYKCRELFGEYACPNKGFTLEEEKEAWESYKRRRRRGCISKYRGVRRAPGASKYPWSASVSVNGKVINKGSFPTEEDAARVYNEMALKFIGPSAILNDV